MNGKFIEYFRDNFFTEKEELDKFINSLTKRLTKTLRINTSKITIEDAKARLFKLGYILSPTFQKNVFYFERSEDFDGLERRLGFSIEHLLGLIYIQELGASSSVYYLSNGTIDNEQYLILDMASSPGGKTTQLAEYYPNSFIVANEFDKNRIPQLISNIERMGLENYGITNYNGQFIGRQTEVFDKILLDAPCSGEGTGFKSIDALKYRNIKNVKKISELQKKLIEAGFNALKVNGELLYSTCTMNKLENESVIEFLNSKHPGTFEIKFEKRFWPHIDETGGFYVCKIRKLKSINYKSSNKPNLYNQKIENLNKRNIEDMNNFFAKVGLSIDYFSLFKYGNKIITIGKNGKDNIMPYINISQKLYFFKLGKEIGSLIDSNFIPNYVIGRDYGELKINKYTITSEQELDRYLRGFEIGENIKESLGYYYIQLTYKNLNVGLGEINENGNIKNWFPKNWMRK